MFDFTLLISAIVFITIDTFYLNSMKGYFEKQVQSVQGSEMKINFLGAALCYLFLIIGINYFIIKPKKSVQEAFLLGLVIYGVYETTTYSVLNNWKFTTVLTDTLWGGILFYLTTIISYKISNQFP